MSSVDVLARPKTADGRAWLELARISNAPTAMSNAVAGAALASAAAPAGPVALVALAIALFYTAGMILNDLLDLEVDRRERPQRPLPSGRIAPRAATLAAVGLLAAGELLLVAAEPLAALAGAGLVALIVAYDAWHKGNPLSPVLMGGCRAMVYVVAAVAIAGSVGADVAVGAVLLGAYVVGLTQVAKAEGGGLAARWPVLAVLAPAAWWAPELSDPAVLVVWLALVAWSLHALRLVLVARRVGAGVAALIAGVALADGVAVAATGGPAAAVAACAVAFLVTVILQTRIAGT